MFYLEPIRKPNINLLECLGVGYDEGGMDNFAVYKSRMSSQLFFKNLGENAWYILSKKEAEKK